LLDTFLLGGLEDPNTYIAIGAIIAAFASVAGLIITIRQSRDAKFLEFIKEVDTEITEHLEKELTLKGEDDCIVYAYNYIDICDRIAFLIEKNKIQREFLDYYRDFFNYSVTVMWWYTTRHEDRHSLKLSWPPLIRWILKEEGTPYPVEHLAKEMIKFLSEKEKNTDEKTLYSQMLDRINDAKSK